MTLFFRTVSVEDAVKAARSVAVRVQDEEISLTAACGRVLAADIPNIKSVEITMVARTARSIKGYIDTVSYENQHGTEILAPPNDNFRRICLTTRIKCRNL